MNFEFNNQWESFGKICGYVFSYLLFTFVLSFILTYSHVITNNFDYFYVVLATLGLVVLAKILKRLLK